MFLRIFRKRGSEFREMRKADVELLSLVSAKCSVLLGICPAYSRKVAQETGQFL